MCLSATFAALCLNCRQVAAGWRRARRWLGVMAVFYVYTVRPILPPASPGMPSRPVSRFHSGRFAWPYGPFRAMIRPVLYAADAQRVVRWAAGGNDILHICHGQPAVFCLLTPAGPLASCRLRRRGPVGGALQAGCIRFLAQTALECIENL